MRFLRASLAFAAPILAAPLSSVDVDTRSLSDIYLAAQKEHGVLQVAYGGDEHNQATALSEAFSAQFPNVKVNFTVDLSKYFDGRINKALAQDKLYVDVAIIQTLQDFDAWEERGLLLHYKPPSFDKLWPSLTQVDGSYIPVFGTDVPKSYEDILDPKWKGKIVLTYPNDDDAVLYLFKLIIEQYGWTWLDRLLDQDVQWVRGTATPGEILVLDTNKTISFTSFPSGPGWAYTPPVSDHYMSWAQTSAIFKGTKLPETAKLLQAFLTSEAGQNIYLQQGLPSVRKDITGNSGTIWDQNNTEYVGFHQFMRDRASVEAFRFEIEDKIGTAQGVSPLFDGIFVN